MLITRIELQNTKSYCDEVVTFAEGTNAICGENGAGKSTLLEAIGFALFDYLPYKKQDDFVREGEKAATIAVSFISSQDGREYQVVRRCGSSSDYAVYDPEIGARVASSKADVSEWLRDHLGVEPTTDLTALFRDAVGVPQGLLTAAFLQIPSQRKPIFDKLLQVDEYEQVWKTLRDTTGHLKDKIIEGEKAIARLETEVKRLPDLRAKAESLHTDVSRIEARLAALQADLAEAAARREALEAVEKELDDLAQQVRTLTTRLEGIGEQLATAEKGVAEAETDRAAVEASQPGYEAYEAAQTALLGLEQERQRRDRLQADRAGQEKSLALAQAQVAHLGADLAEIVEAEAQMAGLQPQVERQAELEAALGVAREHVRSLEIACDQAVERQARLDDLQSRLAAVEGGLAEAGQVEVALSRARDQLEASRQKLTDLTSRRAGLTAEADRLTEQTQTLEATETATCPVCEQPLTTGHRADLLGRNRAQLDRLKAQVKTLAVDMDTTRQAGKALEQEVQDLEGRLRTLPRPVDQADLAAQIAALSSALAASRVEIEHLAGSRDEASLLERELADLGDPRRRYTSLAEKASQRAEIERQLEAEGDAVGALAASLAEVEQALTPFADLDARLAAQRDALSQHEADHRRYLENAKIAADLPARRQYAESLRTQQAALTAERDVTQAQAEAVAAGFDAEALAAARQVEAELRAEQARLQGQVDTLRQELAETGREIETLETATQALTAEQAALTRRQGLLALIEFIRDVIKQAGPHVTRRLVQQVSLEAARLFADIMSDYTARLQWNEEYEIVLEKDGRDRTFQQLSGGEQMAAALAVRLALLRELSAIDVAFFDEPTSNLDDTRRDSLAEQILAVKGFSQLFVISHDDTFERVTNHVVRVYKENGVSKVSQE